jgi:hypothetical protein
MEAERRGEWAEAAHLYRTAVDTWKVVEGGGGGWRFGLLCGGGRGWRLRWTSFINPHHHQ